MHPLQAPRLLAVVLSCAASLAQQATWTLASPAASPAGRAGEGLAYDDPRGVAVLFGGFTAAGEQSDTWEWDGVNWRSLATASRPQARRDHGMAFDPMRRRVVLFGGSGFQSVRFSDTWEFDGTNWVLRDTLPTNDGRLQIAMAFCPVRQQVIRFGGAGAGGYFADTQAWDGSRWHLLGSGGPLPRNHHAMATDTIRRRIVLFGGTIHNGSGSQHANDTWSWDGVAWQQVFPNTVPPWRLQHAMAFHEHSARIVMFGGQPATSVEERRTWVFDGLDWSVQNTAVAPPYTLRSSMCFDADRGELLLSTNSGQTWRYRKPVQLQGTWHTLGSGCAGSGGVPVLASQGRSLPFVGEPFRMQVTDLGASPFLLPFGVVGFSATSWGPLPLPLDLGTFGLHGCTAYVEVAISEPMVRSGTSAAWTIPIPPQPALAGADFWAQAFVVDPWTPNGSALSNAGHAHVGRR